MGCSASLKAVAAFAVRGKVQKCLQSLAVYSRLMDVAFPGVLLLVRRGADRAMRRGVFHVSSFQPWPESRLHLSPADDCSKDALSAAEQILAAKLNLSGTIQLGTPGAEEWGSCSLPVQWDGHGYRWHGPTQVLFAPGPVMHYGCTALVVSSMVAGVVAYATWHEMSACDSQFGELHSRVSGF